VLDLILSAIISSNVFQTHDDKIWATVARLVPSSSPEEVRRPRVKCGYADPPRCKMSNQTINAKPHNPVNPKHPHIRMDNGVYIFTPLPVSSSLDFRSIRPVGCSVVHSCKKSFGSGV